MKKSSEGIPYRMSEEISRVIETFRKQSTEEFPKELNWWVSYGMPGENLKKISKKSREQFISIYI